MSSPVRNVTCLLSKNGSSAVVSPHHVADLILVSQEMSAGPRLMYEPAVLFTSPMVFSFPGSCDLLPIGHGRPIENRVRLRGYSVQPDPVFFRDLATVFLAAVRSEERRVGKECRSR